MSLATTYDQLTETISRVDALAFLLEERLVELNKRPDAPAELYALSVLAESVTGELQKVLDMRGRCTRRRAETVSHQATSPAPDDTDTERLPVETRDAITRATARAKGMLALVVNTLNEDDVLITVDGTDDADRTGAVLEACDVIGEAFTTIDEAFRAADAADKRGIGRGTDTKGGS
jgi:hypothetical protein